MYTTGNDDDDNTKQTMASVLSDTFMTVDGSLYNFTYVILPTDRLGTTGTCWQSYYTAVTSWEEEKKQPKGWITINMAPGTDILYRPIQPFDLSKDPVSKYVAFEDYFPPDSNPRFKRLKTLVEIEPGAWPLKPPLNETLIGTHLDMEAIAAAAEEEEEVDAEEEAEAENEVALDEEADED